ncbi:MAG: hypothetical protein M0C28_21790 [Candidatus Moduliflexus flocculans]|nr:hypothetical protein [Candidatus Moduliflexus flocculans]
MLNLVLDARAVPAAGTSPSGMIGDRFLASTSCSRTRKAELSSRASSGEPGEHRLAYSWACVNVFADIISYIRLWAVGLAGVAISQDRQHHGAARMLGKAVLVRHSASSCIGFGHSLNLVHERSCPSSCTACGSTCWNFPATWAWSGRGSNTSPSRRG